MSLLSEIMCVYTLLASSVHGCLPMEGEAGAKAIRPSRKAGQT
jgi:hypothetical protein